MVECAAERRAWALRNGGAVEGVGCWSLCNWPSGPEDGEVGLRCAVLYGGGVMGSQPAGRRRSALAARTPNVSAACFAACRWLRLAVWCSPPRCRQRAAGTSASTVPHWWNTQGAVDLETGRRPFASRGVGRCPRTAAQCCAAQLARVPGAQLGQSMHACCPAADPPSLCLYLAIIDPSPTRHSRPV